MEELKTKRIGVEANTTNEAVLKSLAPDLQIIVVNSRSDGFAKLQQGVIDGYASDGILLEALRQSAPNPDQWDIIPNDELVHLEAYACVRPQDDSHWRDLVNYSILRVIQGYIIEDPECSKMFAGWFGEQGVIPYPKAILEEYFQGILDSKERIPTTAF